MPRYLLSCIICLMTLAQLARADETPVRRLSASLQAELKIAPTPYFVFTGSVFTGSSTDRPVVNGQTLADAGQVQQLISISVDSSTLEKPPAIIGRYQFEDNRLEFYPRYPLSRSVVYRLQLADSLLDENIDQSLLLFALPADPSIEAAEVAAVYPSADQLPENLLKFYIHFSQPMSRGVAYQHIHLFHDQTEIREPFLELGEELWDAAQTRFTLFIHPGRIKRGVQPRELNGAPLASGNHYVLRIAQNWQSAAGLPLQAAFEKSFSVTPPVYERVNPEQWKIETPRVGTTQPVELKFDAPLDQAMLSRVLSVKFNDGSPIEGSIAVRDHETRWSFSPTAAWKVGAYRIEVETILEDLSGNSIARPFEVKMQSREVTVFAPKIAIEFIVK